jgi:hypothetical protein
MQPFKFLIHPDYLAAHALFWSQGNRPFPEWSSLKTDLEEKYGKIPFNYREALWFVFPDDLKGRKMGGRKDKWVRSLVRSARKSKEFKQLHSETEVSLRKIEKEWISTHQRALKGIEEITGLVPLKRNIPVYLTHPRQGNGVCCGWRTICYSHREDWRYYDTIYLCHELLHIMTRDNSELMHAIIKLAVDNELRVRLQGGGKYFGRRYGGINARVMQKILPYWKEYLENRRFKTIIGLKRHLSLLFSRLKKEESTQMDAYLGMDSL